MKKYLLFVPLILLLSTSAYGASRTFFDGSEAGNTNLWSADDFRDRCTSVTSSADGITGPRTGSRMIRCNSNGTVASNAANRFENLVISSITHTSETFIRVWMRVDANHAKTSGSPKKVTRVYAPSPPAYNDSYYALYGGDGCVNQCIIGGNASFSTYWGGSDSCSDTSGWHKMEFYANRSTGNVKQWIDDVLVRNATSSFGGQPWYPFYLTSNWSDTHDATNYLYFDDMEIFSDSGSGATGSMSNGDVEDGGGATNHTITISKSGTGTVTSSPAGINCGATCAASYADTTVVTLTASPPGGATFDGWSGGGCSGTGTCQITVSADVTVTATFTGTPSTHTITASKTGAGAAFGLVTSSPSGINCGSDCSETFNDDTVVTLSHGESSGVIFTGWSGGGCSGTGTCQVTVSADVTVTAVFAGAPSIALIQSIPANGGSTTSLNLAYSTEISAGNLLVASARVGGVDQLSAVTDDNSNTWQLACKQAQGSDHYLYVYYAANANGGATIVNFAVSTSQTVRAIIHEYAGLATSSPLDQCEGDEGTGTSISSGNATTTQAEELVFSAASVSGTKTFSAGSNFTLRQEIVQKAASEDRTVTSTGSYAGTWTVPTSDSWAAVVATFKAAEDISPPHSFTLTSGRCSGCRTLP